MLRESAHKSVLEAASYKFSYKMLKALQNLSFSSPAFMPHPQRSANKEPANIHKHRELLIMQYPIIT